MLPLQLAQIGLPCLRSRSMAAVSSLLSRWSRSQSSFAVWGLSAPVWRKSDIFKPAFLPPALGLLCQIVKPPPPLVLPAPLSCSSMFADTALSFPGSVSPIFFYRLGFAYIIPQAPHGLKVWG